MTGMKLDPHITKAIDEVCEWVRGRLDFIQQEGSAMRQLEGDLPQTEWERRLLVLMTKPALTPGEQVELDLLLKRKWSGPNR